MIDPFEIAISVLVPGLFVWGSVFFLRRFGFSCRVDVAAALGIAAGLFALRWIAEWNSLGAEGTISESLTQAAKRFWLPKEARDWLAVGCVIAVPLLIADHWLKRPRWFLVVWGAATSFAIWRFLIGSVYFEKWSAIECVVRLVGIGIFSGSLAWVLAQGSSEEEPRSFLKRILLTVVFGVGAIVAMTSGSLTCGIIGIVATAACGHGAMASSMLRSGQKSPISHGFWMFCLAAYLANALFFAEMTTVNFGLLLQAAGIVGIVGVDWPSKRKTRTMIALGITATLLLAGVAGGLSVKKFLQEMEKKSNDPYSSMY